ncbi:hypothetical protein [Neptuniibacter halophilus]|uniref:hypothetical protein n=1 Tax=Neptuniibacter halophilus TaxID=651666 RepID=UPI00257297D1|nr:hypothetical protein [Neptuniibacter halophilus]
MLKRACLAIALLSSSALADSISYSTNITERRVFQDWVAYQTSDPGDCRVSQEFVVGQTLASLVLLQASGPQAHEAWFYVYGEYVEGSVISVDSKQLPEDPQQLVDILYQTPSLEVQAYMTGIDTPQEQVELSTEGLKQAMAYCGYSKLYDRH